MSVPNYVGRNGTSQSLWECLHQTGARDGTSKLMGMSAPNYMARDGTSLRSWVCLHLTIWLGMGLL